MTDLEQIYIDLCKKYNLTPKESDVDEHSSFVYFSIN